MRARVVGGAFLLAELAAAGAFAQGRTTFEIAPFIGYRFGGSVSDTSSAARSTIDGARSLGVAIDVPIRTGRALELLFSRQGTGADLEGLFDTKRYTFTIDHWMVGGLGEIPGHSERVRPFVATYVGLTNFRTSQGGITSDTMFTAALGGGVKLDLERNIGARFDARVYAIFVASGAGLFCASGCTAIFGGRAMLQGEVAAALLFKF